MANHTYSKGLLYKKTLNSSGEVTGSVPLLLKTLGSLVIMSDGTDAETAISTAISNMVTPDETTIVTGQDGITISVKKSTSAEIDEILGDVPTEHTWEGYYTKSEVNGLVNAVDAKFNQNDIETALGYTPIASSTKGSANGVASLDANGLVPSAQLPSYVDDVIESATFAALPATGETGKIYVTLNDNKTYRWSGSAYVEISQSLALGETSSTAFAGDKGKIAYDHASDTTKHIPTGGTNAQYLKNTGNNTYAWASPDSSWPATPTNNTIPGNKLVDDRFKVNETNILYGLNTGVKNWFVVPNGNYSSSAGGAESTWEFTDGACKVIKCTSNDTRAAFNIAEIKLPAGDYVMTGRHLVNGACDVRLFKDGTNITTSDVSRFTLSTESVVEVAAYTYGTASVGTILKPLLCTAEAYAQSHDYQPPALPNYDLTRLESEDRAALAEEIDAGPKNLLQLPSSSSTSLGITFNSNPNTGMITASGTKESGDCFMQLANISLTNFPRKFVAYCNSTENTKLCITIIPHRTNGTYASTIAVGTHTTVDLTSSTFDSFLVRAASYADTGATLSNEKIYPMICTKAAFGVSTKFVPYTKSNSQLTTELGSVKTVLEAIL